MKKMPTEKIRKEIGSHLLEKYTFLKSKSIGKSLCNREIVSFQLGNQENSILWAASFHGMEWLTSLILLKFLNNICKSIYLNQHICGIDIEKRLKERGLTIIPCVNPDGVEISLIGAESAGNYKYLIEKTSNGNTSSWQANAAGVDLNHNYDANWKQLRLLEIKNGIIGPASTRYGGNYPFSEPETQALVKLCKNNYFAHAIAFHSQGEEIYWKYGPNIPPHSESLASSLAFACEYTLSSPKGLAIGGGFKDWFITEFNRPAFTVEIGKGKNPLPISDLESIYKKLEKMFLISAFS